VLLATAHVVRDASADHTPDYVDQPGELAFLDDQLHVGGGGGAGRAPVDTGGRGEDMRLAQALVLLGSFVE